MPQPTKGTVHVNRPLTNISVAFMQDQNAFVADKVFPVVPVDKQSNVYFTYDKEAFARAIAEERSGASQSAGGGWKQSTGTYFCRQRSFHHDVPADIAANTDDPLDAERDATLFVTRAMLLKREVDFAASYFVSGSWTNGATLSGTGQWSDYTNSDPATAIADARRTVQLACLAAPNVLLIGAQVYDKLKNHPLLRDRYKYTSSNPLTVNQLSEVFDMKVIVGEGVKATNVEGQATTTGFIFGKHALMVYTPDRPSLLTPSAGYIFTWNAFGNGYGAGIKKFPMPELNDSQRVEGDFAYDPKVVSADAGYFFTNAVA
jgi:hypothetical protein